MIWQVIVMNGQQRPLAVPTILVLAGGAFTPSAATTRAFAATAVRALAMATVLLGHFYICRTEC